MELCGVCEEFSERGDETRKESGEEGRWKVEDKGGEGGERGSADGD